VPGSNPVRLLVKLPDPDPSMVLELLIIGFGVVAQHTPFAVTGPPPSVDIFPPETAVDKPIEETAVVETVGTTIELVVNVRSTP
jgi:hypothetical protein